MAVLFQIHILKFTPEMNPVLSSPPFLHVFLVSVFCIFAVDYNVSPCVQVQTDGGGDF